jgi:hypothetical protein
VTSGAISREIPTKATAGSGFCRLVGKLAWNRAVVTPDDRIPSMYAHSV